MQYHSSDHPQYFPGVPGEVDLLSLELMQDMTIVDVAKAIDEERHGMELDDDIHADINGYIAYLMSEDNVNKTMLVAPDYEYPADEVEEPWRAYFVLGRSHLVNHPYEPIRGVIQWVGPGDDLPDDVDMTQAVRISLPNWGAHHLTNVLGIMIRPYTELGDMEDSFCIIRTC